MTAEEEMITFSVGNWIPKIFSTIFVLAVVIMFVHFYSKISINTFDSESEIFINRLLYSPDGISYQDPLSGRLYPGMIDISRFSNSTIPILQKSIDFGADKHIGASIKIKDFAGVAVAYGTYNPDTYRRTAEVGPAGPAGADLKQKQMYVLINDNGRIYPGMLDVSVVVERSR